MKNKVTRISIFYVSMGFLMTRIVWSISLNEIDISIIDKFTPRSVKADAGSGEDLCNIYLAYKMRLIIKTDSCFASKKIYLNFTVIWNIPWQNLPLFVCRKHQSSKTNDISTKNLSIRWTVTSRKGTIKKHTNSYLVRIK